MRYEIDIQNDIEDLLTQLHETRDLTTRKYLQRQINLLHDELDAIRCCNELDRLATKLLNENNDASN